MKILKGYVKNKYHLEASIVQSYNVEEVIDTITKEKHITDGQNS